MGMRFPELCRAYASVLSMPWMDIREMRCIRQELRDTLFLSEYLDTLEATVSFHGKAYQPFVPARATSLPSALAIPGERLAIVLEETGR